VVVSDFNVVGISILPFETNAPLFVDSYAVLASSIALQRFQSITRQRLQIFQRSSSADDEQLAQRVYLNALRQPSYRCLIPYAFGVLVFEGQYHA
jgi:hypothetical protein